MSQRIVTRLPIGNHADYNRPNFWVEWTELENGRGFNGKATKYNEDGTQSREFELWVGVTVPATGVHFSIESCVGGYWAAYTLPVCAVTNETLWWASAIALESLRHHPDWTRPVSGAEPDTRDKQGVEE